MPEISQRPQMEVPELKKKDLSSLRSMFRFARASVGAVVVALTVMLTFNTKPIAILSWIRRDISIIYVAGFMLVFGTACALVAIKTVMRMGVPESKISDKDRAQGYWIGLVTLIMAFFVFAYIVLSSAPVPDSNLFTTNIISDRARTR